MGSLRCLVPLSSPLPTGWWLTVDSLNPTRSASPPVVASPVSGANNSDISFTRAGSASASSRTATPSAVLSSTGPAATGDVTILPEQPRAQCGWISTSMRVN